MEDLVDSKIKRILKTLIKNKDKLYHLQQLASESEVPISTAHRLVRKLVKLDYIGITKVGKLKLYRLSGSKKAEGMRLK